MRIFCHLRLSGSNNLVTSLAKEILTWFEPFAVSSGQLSKILLSWPLPLACRFLTSHMEGTEQSFENEIYPECERKKFLVCKITLWIGKVRERLQNFDGFIDDFKAHNWQRIEASAKNRRRDRDGPSRSIANCESFAHWKKVIEE